MVTGLGTAFEADGIQYDVQEQRNAATFEQLIWQTRSCMSDGAQGMLAQGVRDSSAIVGFIQGACGGPLVRFMTQTLRRPDPEASAFVLAIAHDELTHIPGLGRINGSSSTSQTISTFKDGKLVGTRKTEASELRDAAKSLADAFRVKAPDYERMEAAAKSMAIKDRCFNLFGSKVALASIEAGMLDASKVAEGFFRNSVASLEAANVRMQVTCEMR